MTPEIVKQIEQLPEAERTAYLKSLSPMDMLDFALACSQRFLEQAYQLEASILEGLDARLGSHEPSRVEAARVLARFKKRPSR